ncbi:hypothetical protein [Marinobacter sp. CA1]|uniref:hypothetical protein n=1 Tax=Marinobacter sp. CA1 TaxID=2817656 RepID=UPI001D096D88|nr:hypothetical protein [Marinobacter sp. CA1]UDL07029.1 hypothetical protein J2887_09895 [Marinobacter sp. CA1]
MRTPEIIFAKRFANCKAFGSASQNALSQPENLSVASPYKTENPAIKRFQALKIPFSIPKVGMFTVVPNVKAAGEIRYNQANAS